MALRFSSLLKLEPTDSFINQSLFEARVLIHEPLYHQVIRTSSSWDFKPSRFISRKLRFCDHHHSYASNRSYLQGFPQDIFSKIISHQNEVPLRSELQDLNHGTKVMLWMRNTIKALSLEIQS